MILSMGEQTRLFVLAVITGFVGGCIYMVLAFLKKIIKHDFWFVQAEDFVFWLVFSVVFFLIYYKINFADIREYNFFGVAVGMSMSFLSVKKLFGKIMKKPV